jgi:DnaJ-class molecular chaperone
MASNPKINYYEVLEIYPAATQEEIDAAFRGALYKYHPDHNPDRPDWAHERTSQAVEAYKILSDPMRRKIYNFIIFANLKKAPPEVKFNIFQGGDRKKYEEACRYFAEGVELYDMDKAGSLLRFQQAFGTYKMSEAVYNVGVIYTITNKLSEAMRAFKEALKIEPDNQQYLKTADKLTELVRDIDRAQK